MRVRDMTEHELRELASDPRTSSPTLAELSQHNSDEIRLLVARNSSTPGQVLFDLANINQDYKYAVTSNLNSPPELLAQFEGEPEFRRQLAANPNTPAECLTDLASEPGLQSYIAANPSTPGELLNELIDGGNLADAGSNPKLTLDQLKKCAELNSLHARRMVAQNPTATPEILSAIYEAAIPEGESQYELESVYIALAGNLSTPPEILAILSGPAIGNEIFNACQNPNTPSYALEQAVEVLADEDYLDIIAGNPNAPVHVLEHYAAISDGNEGLQIALAENPTSPAQILEHLCNSNKPLVEIALARNPKLPVNLANRLSTSDNREVAASLVSNRNCPANLKRSISESWLF